MKLSYIQSSKKSIYRRCIQIGEPQGGCQVGGDPEVCCAQWHRSTFALHKHWIPVEPQEKVSDIDGSTELIDNDVCMRLISIPPLKLNKIIHLPWYVDFLGKHQARLHTKLFLTCQLRWARRILCSFGP